MKTITLEEDISLEQFVMVVKLLDAINIKVKIPKNIEHMFNDELGEIEKQ